MQTIIRSLLKVPEIELSYRNDIRPNDRPKVIHAIAAYDILINAWDMNKIELLEQAYVLLLSKNSSCLGVCNIATGGVSSCIVDPRIVFATALKANATAIILAHNHPSGNLTPSKRDLDITKKIHKGGEFLDIRLLDHLLITSNGFYSMANEGDLPECKPFP
jgi:DNA repair protein RadC